ncbi:unnamed protein product [Nezara viridula]|uniref:Uncharacterized protein n=1 Tax=Nezara viridula TaxID=85310 RepID=A0A9P0HD81_NEZVI|nr:unnamed protein product [Nezara viridula]
MGSNKACYASFVLKVILCRHGYSSSSLRLMKKLNLKRLVDTLLWIFFVSWKTPTAALKTIHHPDNTTADDEQHTVTSERGTVTDLAGQE